MPDKKVSIKENPPTAPVAGKLYFGFSIITPIHVEIFLFSFFLNYSYTYWLTIFTIISILGGENGDGMLKEKPPPTFEQMWFDDPIEVDNFKK